MAKGNINMGTLKGRIGDQVFYVKAGEQNVMKYQPNVTNPQTNGQMLQRGKFAAAAMFYAHGRQAFFDFAYEDRQKGESFFNAFMRHNVKTAWPVSKSIVDSITYPVYNYWLLTKGSLSPIITSCLKTSQGTYLEGHVPYHPAADATYTTIGELSTALKATGTYEEGDIITLLHIHQDYIMINGGYPTAYPDADLMSQSVPEWRILQFNVKSSDTTTLASIGLQAYIEVADGYITLRAASGSVYLDGTSLVNCGSWIHSRKTKSGTKVSTQVMQLDPVTESSIETVTGITEYSSNPSINQTWISDIIADWKQEAEAQAQPSAILQGSQSVNASFNIV